MKCPNCAGEDIIPITYGTPPLSGTKLKQAIEAKTIRLGGCYLCGDAPAYYCRSCDHCFDLPKPDRRKWRPFWKEKPEK